MVADELFMVKTQKPHFVIALTLVLAFAGPTHGAVLASYNIIGRAFKAGLTPASPWTGPGQYDIFNANSGLGFGDIGFVGDGQNDIEIDVTTFGTGLGNGVAYSASFGPTTTTGLVSTLAATGAAATNNNGHRWGNIVDIKFLPGVEVRTSTITGFTWSSGNTSGVGWEVSQLGYLDASFNPIGTPPTIPDYLANSSPVNGQSGNWFVADSTGTVTGVGTGSSALGTSGSNNNYPAAFDTPAELGITSGTVIGGVRFVHFIEDTRGTANGNSSITSTINNLALSNVTLSIVPEPSRSLLTLVGLGLVMFRRRRR